jgi:hypothetical protein
MPAEYEDGTEGRESALSTDKAAMPVWLALSPMLAGNPANATPHKRSATAITETMLLNILPPL